MSKIMEALGKLDPANENHWTAEGLPRIDTVKFLAGDQSLTREEIQKAAPEFCREFAAAQGAKAVGGGTGAEQAPIVAPVADTQAPAGEPAAEGVVNGEVHSQAEAGAQPELDTLTGAALEEEFRDAQERLAQMQHYKVQLDAEIVKQQRITDALHDKFQRENPPETTGDAIRSYHASQLRQLEERRERMAAIQASGIDFKALLNVKAPIDAARVKKAQ